MVITCIEDIERLAEWFQVIVERLGSRLDRALVSKLRELMTRPRRGCLSHQRVRRLIQIVGDLPLRASHQVAAFDQTRHNGNTPFVPQSMDHRIRKWWFCRDVRRVCAEIYLDELHIWKRRPSLLEHTRRRIQTRNQDQRCALDM